MYSTGRRATLAVNITFFALTWITVSLRVLVRAAMLRAFGSDDWTMLITQLLFTAYLIVQLGGVYYGTGEHLSDLIPWRAERALQYWYFCEIFYVLSTCLLKISVSLFLLRVATHRLHIFIIHTIMVVSALLGFTFFFVLIFQCYPVSDWWSLDPLQKHCINPTVVIGLTYAVSGLNVIADWTLGILPIFVVRGLDMSKRQKRLVAGILSFAAVGSTATIVRLPYIGSLKESFLGSNGNFLYNTVGVAIWTTVEVGIGISAGCLATLRPLIRLAFSRFGITSSSNHARELSTRERRSHHASQHSRRMRVGRDADGDFVLVDPGRGRTVTTITGGRDESPELELVVDGKGRVRSGEDVEAWAVGRGRKSLGGVRVGVKEEEEEEEVDEVYEREVYEMGERSRSRSRGRRVSVWSIPSRH
ncbi:unnamed protein product [Zymoseptoria tritici ST99CH_3D7]|uniref:Rhodopsin domain-containing protein n=1 Tax=Zymoseptoria tritici (strain ST99CH_3D7) TaxID=1276538 RepID=A0A1X7RKW4_ZYMT9|nr:unnamed protein product [Zymoseptoria tritici ST99CH_3D7]